MVTRHNPTVPAFGVPSVSSALALLTGAREAPHAPPRGEAAQPPAPVRPKRRTPRTSVREAAQPPAPVRTKCRTPRTSVRAAAQPHARKHDERKVLEDQITIRE